VHVTHIVPTLDQKYGGPVTSLCGFAAALQREGVGNSIFAALREGEQVSGQAAKLADIGVEFVTVADSRGGRRQHPQSKQELSELIARTDVVHVHGVWEAPHAIAVDLCREGHVPYVIRPCGMLSRYCLAQKRLKKWAYNQLRLKGMIRDAAAIHFTSAHEAGEAPGFIPAHLQIVETLGIDFATLESESDDCCDVRQRYEIAPKDTLLAFLGRLHPIKGLETLLEAVQQLVANNTDVSLLICGPAEDGYDRKLRQLVNELGLTKHVRLTGMIGRSEIRDVLSQSDIFVLPSHHENFGVSALEALACGTPIVISEHVGIECFLKTSQVGIVTRNTSSDLSGAILKLIESPELRQSCAANCRQVAKDVFAWNSIAQRWIRRYELLMEQVS
jgi:glycosyltransferase involved in cell wall biosynthesis